MSITDQRIQASQETAVRTLMTTETQKLAADMTISDLVKAIISGDLARRLSSVSKVIVPIKRVEIRKTEVLEMGNVASQQQSIIEQAAEKPAAPTEAVPATEAEESEELKAEEEVLEEQTEEEENKESDEK
jgi:small subunit ribosomal protein S3Ae